MPADAALAWWRARRDEVGDTYLLALVRIALGLLLLNEAKLATSELHVDFFGDRFHQPALPASLVPSEGVYTFIVLVQWATAALVLTGRLARPALLVAAALLVYTMLCDRLWFHNYRHTMATFAVLLAFAPCDRYFVLGRPAAPAPASVWVQRLVQAQVSIMYLASAGSKVLDPDWRGGVMMRQMLGAAAPLLERRHVPHAWLAAIQTPLGASLVAKGAIATEIALALALAWPRTRRGALWVGIFFHLTISLITPVQLFTAMMLAAYLLFITPDAGARKLRFDPARHAALANLVGALDWVKRFDPVEVKGSPFVVVARDGRELRGLAAAAEIFGATVPLFPLWPALAIATSRTRRRARGAARAPADSA